MDKQVLIRQPAGLGDILWTQKIAQRLIQDGFKVYWPVIPAYDHISRYIEGPNFIPTTSDFFNKDKWNNKYPENNLSLERGIHNVYLPLQDADQLHPTYPIMQAKYKMVDLDWDDWLNYLNINWDLDKGESLIDKLEIRNKKYCFVARNYGSPGGTQKFKMDIQSEYPIIELEYIDGYSVFDWCCVIENAAEIKIIDGVLNFLFEKLHLSCVPEVWSRRPEDWSQVDFMFKKQYIKMN